MAEVLDGVVEDGVELEIVDAEHGLRELVESQPRWRDRYDGWTEVGTGSFATVVRTQRKDRGQVVAVKVFHQRLDRKRFDLEVRNAALMQSAYTVPMHAPSWGVPAWIEMEYVDGPTLKEEIERRMAANEPFAMMDALEIGIDLATVVVEAHKRKIVHRDVKPANVLLPRSGTPRIKLIDFGVSCVAGQVSTMTGSFRGTPQFGSPEAFVGDDPLGPQHDVYALGLCLYMVFTTGQFPWRIRADANPLFFMGLHLNQPPSPARLHVPALDQELDYLLMKCLDKDAKKRPRAHGVLRALEMVRWRYTR